MKYLALLLPIAGVCAQEPLTPRAFLPQEYSSEVVVDLDAMRDAELLGALQRSPFGMLLDGFGERFGFELDDVHRAHAVMAFPEEPRQDPRQLWTLSGGEAVGLPPVRGDDMAREELGGRVAVVEKLPFGRGTTFYSPKPGTLVYGTDELIRPVLLGDRKGGVPNADLTSLTAIRGALAYIAFGLNDAMRETMPPFMTEMIIDEDPLEYMVLRLQRLGEDDDPRFSIAAQFRCKNGTKGPAHLEAKVREGLKQLEKDPRLGALKRYWSAIEIERQERDVVMSLDLGNSRQTAAALPLLLAPMFRTTSSKEMPATAPAAPASQPQSGVKK